jgi:ketosteroid isomerase-like protein
MNGEQLMRSIVAAFEQSDLQPLLDALHEDIVWKSASKSELFSFRGEHRGLPGVRETLAKISRDYVFNYMKTKEIVSSGDVVWGYFDTAVTYYAGGTRTQTKPVQLDMAIRWRLKDGKIIEHSAFFDSAYLAMQQLSQP